MFFFPHASPIVLGFGVQTSVYPHTHGHTCTRAHRVHTHTRPLLLLSPSALSRFPFSFCSGHSKLKLNVDLGERRFAGAKISGKALNNSIVKIIHTRKNALIKKLLFHHLMVLMVQILTMKCNRSPTMTMTTRVTMTTRLID